MKQRTQATGTSPDTEEGRPVDPFFSVMTYVHTRSGAMDMAESLTAEDVAETVSFLSRDKVVAGAA